MRCGLRKLRRLRSQKAICHPERYWLKLAVAADPTWPQGYRVLALSRRRLGDIDGARAVFRRAAARVWDPQLAADWGDLELDAGDISAAEAAYRQGLEVDPSSAQLLHRLGAILAQRGALEDAEVLLQRAHGLSPRDDRVLTALGMTRAKRGDMDGAVQALVEVTTRNPKDALAQYQLALVYRDLSSWEESMRHARPAAELDPGNQDFQLLRDVVALRVSSSG